MKKITVVGAGYVGLSNAILLSQVAEVTILDISKEKIEKINNLESPLEEKEIKEFLKKEKINLKGTLSREEAYNEAEFVIIATPTNYDEKSNYFDTKSIEEVIENVIELNKNVIIIIKSTIPIGYTDRIKEKYGLENIVFIPEFLREGRALYDNFNPSRIIVGGSKEKIEEYIELVLKAIKKEGTPVLYMNAKEAEAIKLFSNTYLAMRVAFFNELDIFAEKNQLNTKNIIEGVCLDPRIGDFYNNPSFGYGGYCFPKDTKQLLANYRGIPNNLIGAIVDSNKTRKFFIANQILKEHPKVVGVYRLIMKEKSDNFRCSAIQDIIEILLEKGIEVVIYEPILKEKSYNGVKVLNNLEEFIKSSDLIITNRIDENIKDIKTKIYTRDIYTRD